MGWRSGGWGGGYREMEGRNHVEGRGRNPFIGAIRGREGKEGTHVGGVKGEGRG